MCPPIYALTDFRATTNLGSPSSRATPYANAMDFASGASRTSGLYGLMSSASPLAAAAKNSTSPRISS
nr:MAG: hypothetical protein TU35_04130 [Thermoproteus sp. AZ2]